MSLPTTDLVSIHGTCVALAVATDGPSLAPSVDLPLALATLHPAERALASAMAPARQRDWVAGRAALRAALRRLSPELDADAIHANDRGAPQLPPGWVGSISHKRGLAVALAAPDRGWAIGVDVELDAPPRSDISRRVLTPAELDQIAPLPPDERSRMIMLHFALKEAVYKAIDPYLRRYVGFLEVAVAPATDGTATVASDLPVAVEAAWGRVEGLIVCTARGRAR